MLNYQFNFLNKPHDHRKMSKSIIGLSLAYTINKTLMPNMSRIWPEGINQSWLVSNKW